ncbi:rab-GTPase-TBC domain-containing protein [Irpex lacteus]|nr:rab-GTPase-TBC domain-containing protein [Irpex lacteus]
MTVADRRESFEESFALSDSMVEIKPAQDEVDHHEDGSRYRLLYTKSKVYVNPTAYARDNIPGFVALVKREGVNPTYLLAWLPETLLNEKGQTEWDKTAVDEEDTDAVIIDMPLPRPETYAFSVPLTSIYSLIVNPPSLSSCDKSPEWDNTSTLHFHDDESRSFTLMHKTPVDTKHSTYPPPQSPTASSSKSGISWGGEDLLTRLRTYAHILRSTLQPTLFLLFADDAVDDILAQSSYANSFSPIPAHRRPRPLSSPANPYSRDHQYSTVPFIPLQHLIRMLLSGPIGAPAVILADYETCRHAAQHILSHPLAKPIVPHLPDPVRSLVNASGDLEWGSWVEKGVYLARWARVVAEEGEHVPTSSSEELPSETSSLGVFELLQSTANLPTPKTTRDPAHPAELTLEEMRKEVFRRGIKPEGDLRKKIWPFLLGVYPWEATHTQRIESWEGNEYRDLKDQWWGVPEVFERQDVLEERHRIDVDCRRTDRTQTLFATTTPTLDVNEDEKGMHMRYSTISPGLSDIGAQAPTNEHIERLGAILLTYNFYDTDLGYVQGMSDLCAPVYVVTEADEELTFWCFVSIMNRMKQNFLRDQSGMKKQLSTLQQLIAVMDPELYRHLEKTESLNLFFCFRWILIAFKREFPFEDVLRLWENLWTDYYSTSFVLFVALAVLESHRDVIMRYLVEFDEILKYCNELSMTIDLDSTLAQAEVLFLSFTQLVADMDRRRAEEASSGGDLRRRNVAADQSTSSNRGSQTEAKKVEVPKLSEELRELLKAGS